MRRASLAVRVQQVNLNHHLWDKNGTRWCHYTIHLSDLTKSRMRCSMGTRSLAEARRLRDRQLDQLCVTKTLCRAIGEEVGPDGSRHLILEAITDPNELRVAQERYEAAMTRLLSGARRKNVTQSASPNGGRS